MSSSGVLRTKVVYVEKKTLCRLCLSTKGHFINIFEKTELQNKIIECTNLSVNDGDEFPKYVCGICMRKLNNAYKFKRQCIRSSNIFKKLTPLQKNNLYLNGEWDNNKNDQNDVTVKREVSNQSNDVDKEDSYFVQSDNIYEDSDPLYNISDESIMKCTECNMQCKSTKLLKSHMKSHITNKNEIDKISMDKSSEHTSSTNSFMCNTCGKTFSQAGNLTVHLRSHTGERPFQCDICLKAFTQVGNLYVHKKIHTNVRQYACKQCPMAFKLVSHLKEHAKTHSDVKEHQCNTCGKGFHKSSHLLTHMRIHTGEKPFSCEHCGKFFNDSSNLSTHIRIHTGKKPFVCSHCKKSFGQKISLVRHQQQHLNNKLIEDKSKDQSVTNETE